jgi:choline transport protein
MELSTSPKRVCLIFRISQTSNTNDVLVRSPAKKLPQVLYVSTTDSLSRRANTGSNLTMLLAIVSAFPLFVVLMLKMTDVTAVTNSNLPSAVVIYQATGSKKLTLFLMSWVIVVFMFAAPCQWVSCGRMTWAFAREVCADDKNPWKPGSNDLQHGLPYSDVFSRVNRFFEFPVNATLAAVVFTVIYGVLYLLSTTAFNSIITSAVMFLVSQD